jgi:hypothetical protein
LGLDRTLRTVIIRDQKLIDLSNFPAMLTPSERSKQMTFQDAKDLAIEFGAKVPKFDHTSSVAQCWIDRIAMLQMIGYDERGYRTEAIIAEANRYA